MSRYYSSGRYQPIAGRRAQKSNKGSRFRVIFLLALFLTSTLLYCVPVPKIQAQPTQTSFQTGQAVDIRWPEVKQSAVGAVNLGVLAESSNQQALPTASLAKIFTALMVQKAKPISVSEMGATIQFDSADEHLMNQYIAQLGSYYPVKNGQSLSQYDALRALMIVSANNIADKLAVWSYGSMDAYLAEANAYFKSQGLSNTHIADASGFSSQTVSSASDLLLASQMLMKDPVLKEIVNTPATTIAGVSVRNTNGLLGRDGTVGIKTGNTDEALGCFVIARQLTLADNQEIIVLAVVMGANTVPEAMLSARELSKQAEAGLDYQTVISKNEAVATYQTPWGESAKVVAEQDLWAVVWRGKPLQPVLEVDPVSSGTEKGTKVGLIKLTTAEKQVQTPLLLAESVKKPPLTWRLAGRHYSRLTAFINKKKS